LHLSGQIAKPSAQLDDYGRNKGQQFSQETDAFFHLFEIMIFFCHFCMSLLAAERRVFESLGVSLLNQTTKALLAKSLCCGWFGRVN
jgi:hypothetical protein